MGKNWLWHLTAVLCITFVAVLAYQIAAVRGVFVPDRDVSEASGTTVAVGRPGQRTRGRLYIAGLPVSSTPLIVILHGDAPFRKPAYQYDVAADLASMVLGTRVVALLRPGFADPYRTRSDGDRGLSSGDNYTPEVLNQLAAAIRRLQAQWKSPSVILVGHSGGAVIAADIAALHPGLIHDLFLIACPCDVAAFRRHMARSQHSPLWIFPTHSISPLRTLNSLEPSTNVTAISGTNDPVALPQYADFYVALAQRRGVPAKFITIPNKGHEILDDPVVLKSVAEAARLAAGLARDPVGDNAF